MMSSDSERPEPGPEVVEAGITEVTTEGMAAVTRLATEVTITDEDTGAEVTTTSEFCGVATGEVV